MTPEESLQAAVNRWTETLGACTPAQRWQVLEQLALKCDATRREALMAIEQLGWDLLAVCILARGDALVVRVPPAAFKNVIADADRWAKARAMESAAGLPMGALDAEEG